MTTCPRVRANDHADWVSMGAPAGMWAVRNSPTAWPAASPWTAAGAEAEAGNTVR